MSEKRCICLSFRRILINAVQGCDTNCRAQGQVCRRKSLTKIHTWPAAKHKVNHYCLHNWRKKGINHIPTKTGGSCGSYILTLWGVFLWVAALLVFLVPALSSLCRTKEIYHHGMLGRHNHYEACPAQYHFTTRGKYAKHDVIDKMYHNLILV